ncbi:ATP synthase subunit I [Methylococcus geothermalis]|uniref:F0F1 ATP synthase assembly protein I n=1 Tax=Methylococcus geothermalis TaxID=2681310 RepID=A0A858Q5B3_9GAMM|nr:ATP synthase subunit I [Methylococcus geothermalis]QJD28926.1 F0F1 ATP synthase assembly protein I [Methylococcus geothermalis]
MPEMLGGRLYGGVRRIIRWQLIVMVVCGAVAYIAGGWKTAISASAGGLIAFIPNAFFALRFGFFDPTRSARDIVRAFYVGESMKLVLTGVLFFLAFQFRELEFLPLFSGFIVALGVYWIALLQRI